MKVSGQKVLVLGTGGTIAGVGAGPDAWQYEAAQLGVAQLLAAVPELADVPLEARQVAQIDSKDMDWPVWQALARALGDDLTRPDVAGVVITHGTDTVEETAYLLHALLPEPKPVVLTAAMRPATSAEADGPRNLRDAVRVVQAASASGRHGVVGVMAGRIWSGQALRKAHSWHIDDAFDGGGVEPLGHVDSAGVVADLGDWPAGHGPGWAALLANEAPRVEVVTSHAGADGRIVQALLDDDLRRAEHGLTDRLRGLVVAGTGHGTIHHGLEQALCRAQEAGVVVWRSTRVARGGVQARAGDVWQAAGPLTAAQARVALMLHLLGVPVKV